MRRSRQRISVIVEATMPRWWWPWHELFFWYRQGRRLYPLTLRGFTARRAEEFGYRKAMYRGRVWPRPWEARLEVREA